MLPTFHMNSFKLWAPPHRKSFPPHKSPNPCSPRTQYLPRPKPCHNSPQSTLPAPKHNLPARPPAETSKHGTTSLNNLAPGISEPDVISRYNLQDNTDYGLLSPDISSSDDSLEEPSRLSDIQHDIPIEPVILGSHGSWEDIDLKLSVLEVADNLNNPEMICSYLTLLLERASGKNDSPPPGDHPHIHDSQQLRPSQQYIGPDASYSNGSRGNHHVSGKSTGIKRKTQQLDKCARKRSRAFSTLPSREDSFTTLRSHFVSLPPDERLQFLSWLFEGALPRCVSDCEQGDAWSTNRSTLPGVIGQARRDSTETQGSSRKHMKWSPIECCILSRNLISAIAHTLSPGNFRTISHISVMATVEE
ncbi:hypothetical protein BDV12DRAFT_205534 [Aspergillus spectabilis]